MVLHGRNCNDIVKDIMAIKGQIKKIDLPPVLNKDSDVDDIYVPFQAELRNGFITKSGSWEKRPGYTSKYDTTVDKPVNFLLPQLDGIASVGGTLYKGVTTTITAMTGARSTGSNRIEWAWGLDSSGKKIMILADGGAMIKISTAGTASALGGSPPSAKYLGKVGPYNLYAGYDDTEFTWTASGNSENVTTGDSGVANVKKNGTIKYATEFKNQWIMFKDNEIEVWHNRGGTTPFVRLNELTIPFGLGASYSVVEAEGALYWIDENKKFRAGSGQLLPDQDSYLHEKLLNMESMYGFHVSKERCIRWLSPLDGLCLTYYYEQQYWVEDNHYEHGGFERLPWNSYMEINGKQYFGDYNNTGLIYEWDVSHLDDNGTPINVTRQFKVKLSEAGNQGSINRCRVMVKSGVDNASEPNPQLLIRWRFNDNAGDAEWLSETLNMNLTPNGQPYYDIYSLGLGRIVEFQIVQTDAVEYVLTGMFITVDEKGY